MARYFLILILLTGCSGSQPIIPAPDFSKLPGVARVEVVPSTAPTKRRIIHFLDWHLVSPEKFAVDIGSDDPSEYEAHIKVVEAVQNDLYRLVDAMRIKTVFMEGITPENLVLFESKLEAMRSITLKAAKPDSAMDLLLAEMQRHDLLNIGGVGRLALEKKVLVIPAEEHQAYTQANPVKNGKVVPDPAANESREDAVIRMLLNGPPEVVLVFGGAHDFRDNIARIAPEAEYVRVKVKSYPQ